MTAAIRTEGLDKRFNQVHAVDTLTLAVEEGAIFGFLGPNGAGKSTTIRMLTGMARPSGGQAWVAGAPVTDRRRVKAHIGYLPEEPAFYNWMSPLEYLEFVGDLFGLPAAERKTRARALVEQVGLGQAARRRIGGFSRGMRQRLGLAQALVNRPAVLFLDEPVSALDPIGRKEVLEMIEGLRGQCTVFMSTHILADVERTCDTVAILAQGKLLVEANQAELLAGYSQPLFELECDNGSAAEFDAWARGLKSLAWVKSVQVDGQKARIGVSEVETARAPLFSAAASAGLPLRRIEVVTPSLEDVFLKLVNEREEETA